MRAPTANAGATQTITLPLNVVTLDGTQSTDVDGNIVNYAWTEVSGPSTAALSATDSSITKVSGLLAGSYTFELDVIDDDGAIGKSQVKIIVKRLQPTSILMPTQVLIRDNYIAY